LLKLIEMPELAPEAKIAAIHSTLARAWGRQHWCPAQSRFEVIVGAFLTQNTSWTNVEAAIGQLRAARVLSVSGIRNVPIRELESLVRSSGYFRQKARRLKTFVKFLDQNYGGLLTRMFAQPTELLREQLLPLNGVGPETADSILLYAGRHPFFLVDAYTRRLSERHSILPENAKYEAFRVLFERALDKILAALIHEAEVRGGASHQPTRMSTAVRSTTAQVFNEMHGLIVSAAKSHCTKRNPSCEAYPLQHFLPAEQLHSRGL
jgi:endonuclease III related protein